MRSIVLAVLVSMVVLLAGCGNTQKPLTKEQLAALKAYNAIPQNTRIALEAKNMLGKKVAIVGTNDFATATFEQLIHNGATRAGVKTADFVVRVEKDNAVYTTLSIADKDGNKFTSDGLLTPSDGAYFGQKVANAIGAERRAALLNVEKPLSAGDKEFIAIHRRALGIPAMK